MAEFEKLEKWVEDKFKGKTDKGGHPYIGHLLRVYQWSGFDEAGLLHDILEDTDTTVDELREQGVDEETIAIVQMLTKPRGIAYEAYILRIADFAIENDCARILHVKLADLEDNLNVARLSRKLNAKDVSRLNKYIEAQLYLLDLLAPHTVLP